MISTENTNIPKVGLKAAIPLVDKNVKNSRNMPSIIFIENVEDYAEKFGNESIIEDLNTYHG
jgi:hypothetical protein